MKKDEKRGQVTIFIIICIFICAIIIFLFLLKEPLKNLYQQKYLSSEISQINSYTYDCIFQSGVNAIRIIGIQGGKIELNNNYLFTNFSLIHYGFLNKRNVLPSKFEIENEISHYIDSRLPECFDESILENSSVNIKEEKSLSKTIISNDSVIIKTKFPITISKGNNSARLNELYQLEIPVMLGDIHSISNEIINKQVKNPLMISLTYISSLPYNISVISYNETDYIYLINDFSNNSRLNNIPYSFEFAGNFIENETNKTI
jgi:hypothetical protein